MSLVGAFISLAAAIGTFLLVPIIATVTGVINVIIWTALYIVALLQIIFSIGQNKRLAAALVVGIAVSAALGPPLVSNINIVLRPIDVFVEGPVRPVLEFISKGVHVNLIAVYDTLAPLWNTVWFYVTERAEIWLLDLKDIYNIIAATGDYLQSLSFIRSSWRFVSSVVLYFWDTKSAGGKVEIFNELPPDAHFFRFTRTFISGTFFKFETDPTFGAFPREDLDCNYSYDNATGAFSTCATADDHGEIPFDPANSPDPEGAVYYLRNILFDILNIVQQIGDFAFDILEQFAFPGQKLVFNFTTRVESGDSSWRKIADIFTRIFSFLAGTSFYPKDSAVVDNDPNSVQPKRYTMEAHTARVLRILADILRAITLYSVHTSTVHFPQPLSTPVGTGIEYLTGKLLGVPAVDLVLDPAFTAAHHPIIIRKSLWACTTLEFVANTDYTAFGLSPANAAIVDSAVCNIIGGIFAETFVPGCPGWDGSSIPDDSTRIDYIGELYLVVPEIAQLIEDPSGVATTAFDKARKFQKFVVDQALLVLYGVVYYIYAQTLYPPCGKVVSELYLIIQLNQAGMAILEFFYDPLTCAGTVSPSGDASLVTCFVTLNSEISGGSGIWHDLCTLIEQPFLPGNFNCGKRKRSTASQSFGEPHHASLRTRVWMYAMRLASDSRKAYNAVETCVFASGSVAHTECEASDACAVAPCIDATLDCITDALPSDNMWKSLLETNNNTNVAPRNILSMSLHWADFLRGCSDSYMMRAYESLRKTVWITRQFATKWAVLTVDYVPALFTCMDPLLRATNHTLQEHDNIAFAHCLGLVNDNDQQSRNASDQENHRLWQSTLEAHNIFAHNGSWCGRRLHRYGVIVDDVVANESLSLDHLAYRLCLFQFSFGARATISRTSRRPLSDFIDGWQAVPALLESVVDIDNHFLMRNMSADIPDALQPLPIKLQNIDPSLAVTAKDRVRVFGQVLVHAMPLVEVGATLLHYFADLYDKVATQPSSPEEKRAMELNLLHHHLGIAKRSDGLDPAEAARRSPMVANLATRKRNLANAISNSESHISTMQEFGQQIYWAGEYPMATGATDVVNVPFEFTVDLRSGQSDSSPLLYMRPRPTNMPPGRLFVDTQSNVPWNPMQLSDFDAILQALTSDPNASPQQRQLIASAVAAYDSARAALVPRTQYVPGAAQVQSARASINFMSTAIVSVMRILNRRIRLEGFPAFHAAMLFTQVVTGGQVDIAQLPAWNNGDVGYLPSVGFVDSDVYAEYLANENQQRKRAAFSPMAYYSHSPLLSAKTARLWHAQALLEHKQKFAMQGVVPTTSAAYYERQRRTVVSQVLKRHTTFADRSAFLLRHNMHEDDEVLHLVAPAWWRKRELPTIVAHAVNTTTSRHRFTVIASLQSGNFLGAIDNVLHTLGAPPNVLETALVNLEIAATNFLAGSNNAGFLSNLRVGLLNYLNSLACDYYVNVAATGTGPYKLLCFPNLPERAFAWYLYFPEARNLPLIGYFQDAGYLRWPSAMIQQDCPTPRIPHLQFPPPKPLFLRANTTVNFAPGTFESANGQSAPVYPVDTSNVLGNVDITNWCLFPGSNNFGERPFCPTFDYCTRVYYSPDHFGFVSAGPNLAVIFNDARFIYANAIADNAVIKDRFYAILLLFLVLAFNDFFGSFWSYGIALLFLGIDFFITHTPENWAYLLIYFWFFLEVFPLAAWVQWVPFVLHLYLLTYFGHSFLTPFFASLPSAFPDTLAAKFLLWVASVEPITFFGLSFSIPFLDSATLTGYANSILAAQVNFPSSELNNVMTVASFWNLELLGFETLGVLLLAGFAAGAAIYFIQPFFQIFPALGALGAAFAGFISALGFAGAISATEDLHAEVAGRTSLLASQTRSAIDLLRRQNERLASQIEQLRGRK